MFAISICMRLLFPSSLNPLPSSPDQRPSIATILVQPEIPVRSHGWRTNRARILRGKLLDQGMDIEESEHDELEQEATICGSGKGRESRKASVNLGSDI